MRAAAALLLACAISLAAGCSNDGDNRPVRSVTVPENGAVEVGAEEYRFDPGRLVIRGAGSATRLRLTMRNRGDLAHNLHVRDGEREVASIPSIPPGQERSLSTALPRGTYEFVCTVADHEDLGMVGELQVR